MQGLMALFGPILIAIMVLGSLVDIFQAMYLGKRMYRKWQRGLLDKARKEILASEYEKILHHNNKGAK